MTSNDGNGNLLRIDIPNLSDKVLARTKSERSDPENGRIVNTSRFHCLHGDWDGWIDRVGNDEDVRRRAMLSTSGSQITDDCGVGGEEIVTGHSRFTWNPSRN